MSQVSAAVLCTEEEDAVAEPPTCSSSGTIEGSRATNVPERPLFNTAALRLWLLQCCQNSRGGGLRDKPGTAVDYYHTCYCLSGLAACQEYSGGRHTDDLPPVDPSINVLKSKLDAAIAYYASSAVCELESGMDQE